MKNRMIPSQHYWRFCFMSVRFLFLWPLLILSVMDFTKRLLSVGTQLSFSWCLLFCPSKEKFIAFYTLLGQALSSHPLFFSSPWTKMKTFRLDFKLFGPYTLLSLFWSLSYNLLSIISFLSLFLNTLNTAFNTHFCKNKTQHSLLNSVKMIHLQRT